MSKARSVKVSFILFFTCALFLGAGAVAQPQVQSPDVARYDRKFFVQLRTVFGRFRDSDLDRVFQTAHPIQCSELVNDPGEWRTVAFFNEKRELGDWYRRSFEEVKTDLAVFIFKGVCRGERASVQLTTKFPVEESVEAYNHDRIGLDEIAVNTNAPVRVGFDSQSEAYAFDLPYLFLISQANSESLYSLDPPRLAERYRYATDVVDHWDCKSVVAENVTYQFLICRTTTLPRSPAARSQSRPAFGASAYFILSDGKEASASVKLTFNDTNDAPHAVTDASVATAPVDREALSAHAADAWETPDADERIVNVLQDEFRIRFAPQSWTGRIGNAQVLSAKRLSSLESATPGAGADYCVWLPDANAANYLLGGARAEPVIYDVAVHDQDGQSATSITFRMRTATGTHPGTLQCFFPRAGSAANIAVSRWTSVVGDHLTLEVRP
jgi:hypothetical protein